MSGMAGMVAQGMAMGTGSAIAHHAVDGVMNSMGGGKQAAPAAPAPVAAPAVDACGTQNKTFMDCMQASNSDFQKCQFYYDMLTQCKQTA